MTDDLSCLVCGYYCLGNGGLGCIDKPALAHNPNQPRRSEMNESEMYRNPTQQANRLCVEGTGTKITGCTDPIPQPPKADMLIMQRLEALVDRIEVIRDLAGRQLVAISLAVPSTKCLPEPDNKAPIPRPLSPLFEGYNNHISKINRVLSDIEDLINAVQVTP